MIRPLLLILALLALLPPGASAKSVNLVENPGFESAYDNGRFMSPDGYELEGAAVWRQVGGKDEFTTRGIGFPGNVEDGGGVSQMIRHIDQAKGRWLTFSFRGLAEDQFALDDNALAMKIEFFAQDGTNPLGEATRTLYAEVEKDRHDLTINGNHGRSGAAVWRSYALEELIPFPGVDSIRISVFYRNGRASSWQNASFFVDDFSLVQRKTSLTGQVDPATAVAPASTATVDPTKLISLGGRWYYKPAAGETIAHPLVVTEENADRLFYKSDRLINPFANNMTAWLRAGYKDLQGNLVTQDQFIPDNVTLIFKGDGYLTMKAKNLPNHPTAKFPDTVGTQGYNGNYIQELDKTYRFPLEPVLNPQAKVTDTKNQNHALPMGAIGVAVNGVVFYNPFDANSTDASSLMDRCCGHPSPDNRYHYHKYPICVNTPFVDKGEGHSQVIGFAFDGLPVYGPYEAAGVMAKDSDENPLNGFNAHYDPIRGWHYHVTPGKFPYIIGGYFANLEQANIEDRPMAPPGGKLPGGMFGGGPMGGSGGEMGGGRPPFPPPLPE